MTKYVGRLWPILLLTLVGSVLRGLRLDWQPLWADEGYSIYFSTQPLGRMIALTAHDIHPPLYYLLLHLWHPITAGPTPVALRLFSLLAAVPTLLLIAALAHQLFPDRPRLIFLATLLFAVNPLHLFYSQEVRMYGLALTLSLASTLAFCKIAGCVGASYQVSLWRWIIVYLLTTTAALYTLYYTAFLFLAHLLWFLWYTQGRWVQLRPLLLAQSVVTLLYLPWILYVAGDLTSYVDDKIGADQDVALDLGTYLLRHLLASFAGHLSLPTWPVGWRLLALVALALLIGLLVRARYPLVRARYIVPVRNHPAIGALWTFLLVPTVIAFVINRFYPFFPDGGERLLLFVLPYLLLLVAVGLDQTWSRLHFGKGVLSLLLVVAAAGIWTFYTLPRHRADDYRPLVRQVVQQGTDDDTLLATFPWQVGLWQVYAPLAGLPLDGVHGPYLRLMSDRSVVWGPVVETAIDRALTQGTLWYPGLRSIGSTLPAAIDAYMADRGVLLIDEWYGNTTLRAWHVLPTAAGAEEIPLALDFGALQLDAARVTPTTTAAANRPMRIDLAWSPPELTGDARGDWGMTLRLYRDGHLWAYRDLATLTATTGLLVPAGLPPGAYALQLGVVDGQGDLMMPVGADEELQPLTTLTVTTPTQPLLPARLPIRFPLTPPVAVDGTNLLGYSVGDGVPLAGETLDVALFWQNGVTVPPDRHLYLSLLDENGNGVAGWSGWPIPGYPTTAWSPGALVQTPVTMVLPGTLTTGDYQLGGGLFDPATGEKSAFVPLGIQAVRQRTANFTPLPPPQPLDPPVQIGSHVRLIGYELSRQEGQLTLQLYWQVLQPLFPPHHIFVHLDDGITSTPIAQSDGPPVTATGPAPTGSWQPDEYLVTAHTIQVDPAHLTADAEFRIGLYLPVTGARLPVIVEGETVGDAVALPVTVSREIPVAE